MFSVLLKPQHPTGVYHRAGIEFVRGAPVLLEEVPDAVRKDYWLVVTEGEPIGAGPLLSPSGAGPLGGSEEQVAAAREAQLAKDSLDGFAADIAAAGISLVEKDVRIAELEADLAQTKESLSAVESHFNDATKEIKALEKKLKKAAE